jgi:hypothetical protein
VGKENHNVLDAGSDDLSVDTDISHAVPSLYVTDRSSKALSSPSTLEGSVDMVRHPLQRSLSVPMRIDKGRQSSEAGYELQTSMRVMLHDPSTRTAAAPPHYSTCWGATDVCSPCISTFRVRASSPAVSSSHSRIAFLARATVNGYCTGWHHLLFRPSQPHLAFVQA